MLQIHDIRESRVYQEAKEEGLKEGIEKGVAIARLAAEKKSVVEIAALLEMNVELVRQVLVQVDRD
jgi:predicted transposase YdaD